MVAEGTVDVLAAALQSRVVGRVHRVDHHGRAAAAAVERIHLDVAGPHLPRGRRHGGGGVDGRALGPAAVVAAGAAERLLRRILPSSSNSSLGRNSIVLVTRTPVTFSL